MGQDTMSDSSHSFRIRRRIFGRGVVYSEKRSGRWRKLVLPVEECDHGQARYRTMSEVDWKRIAPEWAWELKDEIEFRLIQEPILRCD